MRKLFKLLGIIAIVAIIGFSITACDNDTTDSGGDTTGSGDGWTAEYAVGDTGPGGGKIFYVFVPGFTVAGTDSFTAHYLEAAPNNQAASLAWASSAFETTNIPGTGGGIGTAIGNGKANTAAILAVDANAPAAKACKDYNGGGKTDWFLPSKDELNEMYKAKSHLGISSGYFWSSSQYAIFVDVAWNQNLVDGIQYINDKKLGRTVRAVRAF